MKLTNFFSKIGTRDNAQERFLAIEIGAETVTTAVWQVVDGKTQIVKVGTTQEWEIEKESIEKLLSAIDVSLEKALEDIEPEPNKAIFGLQEGWVDGQTVSKKYASSVKEICEKFEFEPVGFVVTTEAIVHLFKLQEGTPPTTILIRISESELQVTLVKLGKVVGTQSVSRSEDIGADVEEGLARFEGVEEFPSRMMLLNSAFDLEALKQDLLSYNWLEKLPFLHFPKVEILDPRITITAVAIAGGAEAAKALGLEIVEDEGEEKKPQEGIAGTAPAEAEQPDEKGREEEESQEKGIQEADEIGFEKDVDVALEEKKPKSETDIDDQPPEAVPSPQPSQEKEPDSQKEEASWETKSSFGSLRSLLSMISAIPERVGSRRKIDDIFGSRIKVTAVVAIAFFSLLIGAAVYGYWRIPKATLTLYVRPKTFDKELTLIIDSTISQANTLENRIPGKRVETEVNGEKSKDTTGTRLVGEKAKGEITIYNKTSAQKTFPLGTVLVAPQGLEFTLDSVASVASASSEESDEAVTTVFGKTTTAVTAVAIGAEYNLPEGTEYLFEGFSGASYDAKSESAFTGGTSREVQAVAQKDIDELLSELEDELKQKAANQLEAQEGPGKRVLIDGAETEEVERKINGEVGQELQELTANLSLKVTTLAYNEEDFRQVVSQAISEAVPLDFELRPEDSREEIREVEFGDDTARVSLLYKAALVPKIDEEEIKSNLTGRYPSLAESYLESLPNFSRAEIQITPAALPARLKTFPRRAENITIEVKVQAEQ